MDQEDDVLPASDDTQVETNVVPVSPVHDIHVSNTTEVDESTAGALSPIHFSPAGTPTPKLGKSTKKLKKKDGIVPKSADVVDKRAVLLHKKKKKRQADSPARESDAASTASAAGLSALDVEAAMRTVSRKPPVAAMEDEGMVQRTDRDGVNTQSSGASKNTNSSKKHKTGQEVVSKKSTLLPEAKISCTKNTLPVDRALRLDHSNPKIDPATETAGPHVTHTTLQETETDWIYQKDMLEETPYSYPFLDSISPSTKVSGGIQPQQKNSQTLDGLSQYCFRDTSMPVITPLITDTATTETLSSRTNIPVVPQEYQASMCRAIAAVAETLNLAVTAILPQEELPYVERLRDDELKWTFEPIRDKLSGDHAEVLSVLAAAISGVHKEFAERGFGKAVRSHSLLPHFDQLKPWRD
jgi:hypothetical protein